MKKLPTRFMGVLSRRQVDRLVEALHGSNPTRPGISFLADQGYGVRSASSWYRTFRSLEDRGLAELARDTRGDLMQAYRITADGRHTIVQILRSYPELEKVTS